MIKRLMLFYQHSNLLLIGLLPIRQSKNLMMIIVNEDFNNVTFFSDEMGILNVVFITLTLKMLILMKMILKLLFMSDIWLGVIDLNKV